MFLNHVEKVLNENISNNGEGWTIIDVFSGSGLLAHTAKRTKPLARVIYNDFDGYAQRLNHISDINKLRKEIYELFLNFNGLISQFLWRATASNRLSTLYICQLQ